MQSNSNHQSPFTLKLNPNSVQESTLCAVLSPITDINWPVLRQSRRKAKSSEINLWHFVYVPVLNPVKACKWCKWGDYKEFSGVVETLGYWSSYVVLLFDKWCFLDFIVNQSKSLYNKSHSSQNLTHLAQTSRLLQYVKFLLCIFSSL